MQYSVNMICIFSERLALYAIYDGHAGNKASTYCSENLYKILAEKFPDGNSFTQSRIT